MDKKNKDLELKSLTWKYFWKQKLKELLIVIVGILPFIFVPYYYFILMINIFPNVFIFDYSNFHIWANGFLLLIATIFLIFIILVIFNGLYKFIKWNWEKATKRAKDELNIE